MKLILLAIVACSLVSACRSSGQGSSARLPLRTIARGYHSGLAREGVEVARNEKEWRALWNRHAAAELPRSEPVDVDFDKEMVVCATLGTRPTGGFALEIERLSVDEGGLVVDAIEHVPARDAMLPQIVTQPFHMVATARRSESDVRLRLR